MINIYNKVTTKTMVKIGQTEFLLSELLQAITELTNSDELGTVSLDNKELQVELDSLGVIMVNVNHKAHRTAKFEAFVEEVNSAVRYFSANPTPSFSEIGGGRG